MATNGRWTSVAAAVSAGSLLAAGVVLANGGPFVVKYPNGDPAAKGVLARLDPDLKPTTEDRLKVLKEDLKIAFVRDGRGGDGASSTPRAEVSAAYTIENPTGQELTVDFGFPILRGVYLRMGMGPIPDVRVRLDKEEYVSCEIISNSTIYGIIRARARETITKALAGDAKLAGLVARVKTAAADEREAARQALAERLTGKLKWNERDAALLVEYAGLEFGEIKTNPRDRGYTGWWSEESGKLLNSNLGALVAIGEQKATQFFAQLAARFDAKAASTYEAIFSAWGGDVRERSVDLTSGEVRPREIAVDPKALAKEPRLNSGSDPTVYARVDYFDETAKLTDAEKAACKTILRNLPVVFTFAPMNLLHYQAKFPARSTRVLTVSYSQYAYADTKAPASYQLAYVVHPASLWKDFGPINLQVSVPKGVSLCASADCKKSGREERDVYEEGGAKKRPFDIYTATLKDKTGELFVAVDSGEWNKAAGIKPTAAAAASPKQQTK